MRVDFLLIFLGELEFASACAGLLGGGRARAAGDGHSEKRVGYRKNGLRRGVDHSLQGDRLPLSDEFRVTRAALERYISNGSPDFDFPVGLVDGNSWFADPYRWKSQIFEDLLRGEISKQLPTDRVPAFVTPRTDGRQFHRIQQAATMTADLQQLLEMPVPYDGSHGIHAMPGEDQFTGRWREMWMINEFRSRLRGAIEETTSSRPLLHRLYGLPADFKANVDLGWTRATTGRIQVTREYNVEVVRQGEKVGMALLGPSDHTPAKHRVLQTITVELSIKLETLGAGIRANVVKLAL